MPLRDIIRELLPLFGGQALEDRILDFNIGMKRRNRDTKNRLRTAFLSALPWIPILVWVVTAFYRSTVRKDELLALREERAQATTGPRPQAEG